MADGRYEDLEEELRQVRTRVHRLFSDVAALRIWVERAEGRLEVTEQASRDLAPIVQSLKRAAEIADAIREHGAEQALYSASKQRITLTRWQVVFAGAVMLIALASLIVTAVV